MARPSIFVLNGPNLGLLGLREPAVYGTRTLADIERDCRILGDELSFDIAFYQHEAEHELIAVAHRARTQATGIVINPAALSYHGYGLLDALKMCDCPIVEVHISNVHRREEAWRAHSLFTPAVTGMLTGLGTDGYLLAIRHVAMLAAARASAAIEPIP